VKLDVNIESSGDVGLVNHWTVKSPEELLGKII